VGTIADGPGVRPVAGLKRPEMQNIRRMPSSAGALPVPFANGKARFVAAGMRRGLASLRILSTRMNADERK
jgi:hypothetical protein